MSVYQCPKCGMEFTSRTKFCQKCGCNLEIEFIENPICPLCLKNFPTGTKFCDVDGSKLTSSEKLIPKCVRCGKVYPAGTKFCSDDGGAVIPEALRYGNVAFGVTYPKASLGSRFIAALLDRLIMVGLSIPAVIFYVIGVSKLHSYYGSSDDAVPFLIVAVFLYFIPVVYSLIKDGLGEGQSWGKKAVGLMVVSLSHNTPCTMGQSCLRCLIGGLLALIPFVGWLIEPIMVLATEDGRRLADKVASTQVIEKNVFNK